MKSYTFEKFNEKLIKTKAFILVTFNVKVLHSVYNMFIIIL